MTMKTPEDVCALCYHHKSEAATCNREDCELSSASPCSRLFRSAVSGLWYRNPAAAGSIDCVEINGKRLEREFHEGDLTYIKRLAEWSAQFYPANPKL